MNDFAREVMNYINWNTKWYAGFEMAISAFERKQLTVCAFAMEWRETADPVR